MAVATAQRPRPSRPRAAAAAPSQSTQKTFDFTKRRRWTDVLLSSLPGAALLVLDKYGSIEYAGPGTHSVLGWEIEEVVERNVLDFVNDDDREAFSARLRRAIVHREELVCFTRLRRKPKPKLHTPISSTTITALTNRPANTQTNGIASPVSTPAQDVILFDIRGHALYLDFDVDVPPNSNSNNATPESRYKSNTAGPSSERLGRFDGTGGEVESIPGTVLFFLMAKPYPSRNVAMLNAFLELKLENERLSQRLAAVKLADEADAMAAASSWGAGPSTYGTTANPHPFVHPTGDNAYMTYILKESIGGQGFDAERIRVEGVNNSRRPQSPYRVQNSNGEAAEDRPRRKLKRAHDAAASASPTSASPSGGGGGGGASSANATTNSKDRYGNKDKDKDRDAKAQYVCYTCGRTDSPEWRRGPTGPKTLCNACGLRWAKHAKTAGGGLGVGPMGAVLGAAAAGYAVKGSASASSAAAMNTGPDNKRPRVGMTSAAGAGAGPSALTRGAPQGSAPGGTAVRERRGGGGRRERDGPVAHAGISVTPQEIPPQAQASQAQLVQQQQQQQQQQQLQQHQRSQLRTNDTLNSASVPAHTYPPPPPPPLALGPVVPMSAYSTSHTTHGAALSPYTAQHTTSAHPSLQQAQQQAQQQQQQQQHSAHASLVEIDHSAPMDEYVYEFEGYDNYGGYNQSGGGANINAGGGGGGGYVHTGDHGHTGASTSSMTVQGYGSSVGTMPQAEHDNRVRYTLPHPHSHSHIHPNHNTHHAHTQPDNSYGY